MEESLQLSTEQKLQQRLTPQQVQFVRMLEMTGPEIEDEVQRAIDENPALETVEDNDLALDNDSEGDFNESAEQMQLADYGSEDDIPSYRLEARNHSVNDEYYEPVAIADGETLMETLTSQLAEYELDERQYVIADYIIGNIDDNGYMTRDWMSISDDIAIHVGLDTTWEEVKQVADIVRSLEPAGVGAIDLRDCLLLQLRRKEITPDVKIATEIIADYFDLFSKKHYDRLKSMLSINNEQLKSAMSVICTLNPKPGSVITGASTEDRTRHIIPDFSVEVDNNQAITITLLNNIPDLQIEATFVENAIEIPATTSRQEREARMFIKQKRDEATGFIKMLKLRQETLYRVMTAIVKLQRDFFLTEDESRLRPMILKDIAALTGYDLSVISRATSGKYVMTPSGIYPLKLFFNERPKEDDDISSHEILAAIKEIIATENKRKPLSDEVITQQLNAKGYDIARRTVAKYREKLGLPVARLRKEMQ